MNENALSRFASCADLLDQHTKIHALSVGLTLCATMMLLLTVTANYFSFEYFLLMIVAIVFGVFEIFIAVSVNWR